MSNTIRIAIVTARLRESVWPIRMTLEQLRVFISLAKNQHVAKAVKELNLTQSAASAAIWLS